jgi:hypothetical protein
MRKIASRIVLEHIQARAVIYSARSKYSFGVATVPA